MLFKLATVLIETGKTTLKLEKSPSYLKGVVITNECLKFDSLQLQSLCEICWFPLN